MASSSGWTPDSTCRRAGAWSRSVKKTPEEPGDMLSRTTAGVESALTKKPCSTVMSAAQIWRWACLPHWPCFLDRASALACLLVREGTATSLTVAQSIIACHCAASPGSLRQDETLWTPAAWSRLSTKG